MASNTAQPWLSPRSKQQAVANGQHEFQLNRPGGLDLESFSQLHKFSYAIVWRPVWGGGTRRDGCFVQLDGEDRPERLKVDHHKSFGDFALASSEFQFIGWSQQKDDGGKVNPGSSLPALAYERRDWAHLPDLQDGTKTDDQRQALAQKHGIRGCFAFFRDGAVFEFGGPDVLEQSHAKALIAQFGGTRGPITEEASSLDKRAEVKWERRASTKAMKAGVMADAASPPVQKKSDAYPVGA